MDSRPDRAYTHPVRPFWGVGRGPSMRFVELDFRSTPWKLRVKVLWAALVGGKVLLGGAPTA